VARWSALALLLLCGLGGRASAGEDRSVYLCFVPDTQHLTSSIQWLRERNSCRADNPDAPAMRVTGFTCSGAWCEHSPYCKGTWFDTGRQLLRNLAYDLTGQWDKEDYKGIGDLDGATAPRTGPPDHPRCDAILSLGDMIDIPSFPAGPHDFDFLAKLGGTAYVMRDPDYGDLPEWEKAQADVIDADFWRIIRASGVPYLPIPGNHDPPKLFRRLMSALEFKGAPFFHAQEPSRQQENAILFKTRTGKPFCALNLTEGLVFKTTPGELEWVIENVGCGGEHPTILLQHGGVYGPQLLTDTPAVVTGAATRTKEIVIVAGGHWGAGSSTKFLRQNAANGARQLLVYSNWQEVPLHAGGAATKPYGASEVYSGGLYYTIVRIDAAAKQLSAWDWSPYWRSRKMGNVGTNGPATSAYDVGYDFDATFP
jgi:hypothetical protein